MRKTSFLIIITWCIFSCNRNSPLPVTELIPTGKLDTPNRSVEIAEGCYSDCFILDSLLVLIANCDTSYFHVFNKYTLQRITTFGLKGEAPHDFLRPTCYNTKRNPTATGVLNFYDLHSGYDKEVDFYKILSGVNIADCIVATPMEETLIPCHEINFINEEKIVMRSVDEGNGLFMIYNPVSGKKKNIKCHPPMNIEKEFVKSTYYGLVHANPQENSIAYFSRYLDQVLFFDLEGNMNKSYFFSDIKKPTMSTQIMGVSNESNVYSIRVCTTAEHCFVLRVNQSYASVKKEAQVPVHILKFSWGGELLEVYESAVFPYLFTVDAETNTLYFINPRMGEEDFSSDILVFSL